MSNLFSKVLNIVKGMTIQQAIVDYRVNNPTIANSLDKMGAEVSISGLPDKYNDVPYSTVINGKWVSTVGEYKAEAAKNEYNY